MEKGIDYVISPETSQRKYSDVLFFPIPKEGVEEVLDELRKSGLEEHGFTVVTKAEAIVAREFEELKERYQESEETDESKVARQELRASAESLSPSSPTYYILLFAASLIASAGILLDNAAIVVGSMVIAPLIGPAMASCVGTIINDQTPRRKPNSQFPSPIKQPATLSMLPPNKPNCDGPGIPAQLDEGRAERPPGRTPRGGTLGERAVSATGAADPPPEAGNRVGGPRTEVGRLTSSRRPGGRPRTRIGTRIASGQERERSLECGTFGARPESDQRNHFGCSVGSGWRLGCDPAAVSRPRRPAGAPPRSWRRRRGRRGPRWSGRRPT